MAGIYADLAGIMASRDMSLSRTPFNPDIVVVKRSASRKEKCRHTCRSTSSPRGTVQELLARLSITLSLPWPTRSGAEGRVLARSKIPFITLVPNEKSNEEACSKAMGVQGTIVVKETGELRPRSAYKDKVKKYSMT